MSAAANAGVRGALPLPSDDQAPNSSRANPLVRVGIVSYNTAELLRACLNALPAALDGVEAEIVVVDNASSDHSVELLEGYRDMRLVRSEKNVGYARAMNVALAGSSAPYLFALNPDVAPEPGSLRILLDVFQKFPDVALVAPVLLNVDGSVQDSVHCFPSARLALLTHLLPPRLRGSSRYQRWWLRPPTGYGDQVDVDWVTGAVHCIRRRALAGAPPYTVRWFMYAEDMDLCWRLRQQGWRVTLEPRAQVLHVGNASGALEWSDADREARWLSATYDWYKGVHGPWRARRWAAAQTLGLLAKRLAVSAGVGGHPTTEAKHRHADQLEFLLAFHARRVVHP